MTYFIKYLNSKTIEFELDCTLPSISFQYFTLDSFKHYSYLDLDNALSILSQGPNPVSNKLHATSSQFRDLQGPQGGDKMMTMILQLITGDV